jgi:hypothetical protein
MQLDDEAALVVRIITIVAIRLWNHLNVATRQVVTSRSELLLSEQ